MPSSNINSHRNETFVLTKKSHIALAIAAFAVTSLAAFADDRPASTTAPEIAAGDTLKLSFYEPLAVEKWKSTQGANRGPSFYLHTEFSGEYTVAPDLSITLPMLGRVVLAHRTPEQVGQEVTKLFDKLIGDDGFVSATVSARRPVYIVGAVKNPGAYPYSFGLTPLSVVALAGDVLHQEPDRWALVEAVQVAGKRISATERLQRVLAQSAVLQAELNDTPVQPSAQLIRLAGQQRADNLIAEEQTRRRPVIAAQAERASVLQIAVKTAEQHVEIDEKRLPALQIGIDMRQSRATSLTTLLRSGHLDRAVVSQAESDLVDAQDRSAGVLAAIASDQQNLATARNNAAKVASDVKAELDQKLAELQREIDTLVPEVNSDAGIIHLLRPTDTSRDELHFEIVRGSEVISADITTPLEPGDVVRVTPLRPITVGDASEGRNGYRAMQPPE
jgi:protein involved in polysaccharide export with SLBB domain